MDGPRTLGEAPPPNVLASRRLLAVLWPVDLTGPHRQDLDVTPDADRRGAA